MRKLLILILLSLSLGLSGQMIGIMASQSKAGSAYCAEYQAVYDAYGTAPAADTADAQNTLVEELKTAGVWAEGDLIYVTANGRQANALLNWIAPTGDDNITNTTSAGFTAYEGFQGASATSEYLSTNWNPSTEGVKWTLNDACIGVYLRLDINALESIAGVVVGSDMINLNPRSGGATGARINAASESNYNVANTLGMITVTRTASNVTTFYQDGAKAGTDNESSTAVPNDVLTLLARDGSGLFSNNELAFVFIGGALSDQQVTDMNTAVEKYMDFLGKGVE